MIGGVLFTYTFKLRYAKTSIDDGNQLTNIAADMGHTTKVRASSKLCKIHSRQYG